MLALRMLRRSWPASCRSSAIAGAKSLNFSLTIGRAGSAKVGLAGRRRLALAMPTIAVERRRLCHELTRRKKLSVTIRTPSTTKFESNLLIEMSVTTSLRPTESPVRGTPVDIYLPLRESMTQMYRWQSASLQEQPAIVIGDECTEQSHEVSDGETEGSNGKVGPNASVKSQGQVKKARIEHERGRQIDQSAHANGYRNQRA